MFGPFPVIFLHAFVISWKKLLLNMEYMVIGNAKIVGNLHSNIARILTPPVYIQLFSRLT